MCRYRFMLEVRTLGGDVLSSRPLEPDWEPALQGTRLAGLRRLGVWHDDTADASVEPLWHEAVGRPIAQKVRVRMRVGGREWFADFMTTEYFADAARVAVAEQVTAGRVSAADCVRYAVSAYSAHSLESRIAGGRIHAVDRPQPVSLRDRDFGARADRSPRCGEADASDFEVIVPTVVIDEIQALTTGAGESETGGILIGHLCRHEQRADVGVEVTAQIPARHTVSQTDSLTFTSETWTDVRCAVALRKADEIFVGWWHSHPAFSWCSKCPLQRQRECRYATGFLSADDRALHRSVFPSAFTQALVATHSIAGIETRLFGWRNGVLRPRGFRLTPDAGSSRPPSKSVSSVNTTPCTERADHATSRA